MTRRRAWVVALVALALAGSGATLAGDQSPPRAYTGLSPQRLPFVLTVAADGRTLSLDVTWATDCDGVIRTIRPAATTIAGDGTFAWTGTHVNHLDDGDEDRQRLRLAGRREPDGALTGTWHAERDSYNGQALAIYETCSSGDVKFRVSPRGSTAQPAPQRDRAGHLVISLESQPDLVAVNAGRIWVVGRTAHVDEKHTPATTVTAIDGRTGGAGTPTEVEVDLRNSSVALAAGRDAAWLLRGHPRIGLLRIDARTRRVVRGPRLPAPDGTGALVAGAGGVWVLAYGRVLRADPRSGRPVRMIRLPPDPRLDRPRRCSRGTSPWLVTIHRGAVWVMTETFLRCRSRAGAKSFALARTGPRHALSRIDPRTNRVTRTVPLTREYSVIASPHRPVTPQGAVRVSGAPGGNGNRPPCTRRAGAEEAVAIPAVGLGAMAGLRQASRGGYSTFLALSWPYPIRQRPARA
ncbi:MAG: hypothetical protein LC777_02590 [Actinobacteria bacterium]|nr:hypothetical protein [Actinomycetota bacterium]